MIQGIQMANEMGYCVKCKAKSSMAAPKLATAKNGRKMMTGTCVKCGTKMVKFVANNTK